MSQRSLPDTKVKSLLWSPKRQVSSSAGPYNFKTSFHDWQSDYREGSITFATLSGIEARFLLAFLDSIGLVEPFIYQDEQMRHPRGSPSGAGVLSAGQTGDEIVTEGWDASILLFRAGDQVTIGKRLFTILEDASSNVNGEATLILWPSINSAYTGGTLVKYGSQTEALFCLTEIPSPTITPPDEMQGLTISIREAIASGYIDEEDIPDPEAPSLEKQPAGVILVTWDAYALASGSATGYELWHSYDNGVFEQLDTFDGETFSFSHVLSTGQAGSHAYKLCAIISTGTTGYSAIASVGVTAWDYLPRPVLTVERNVTLANDIVWESYDEAGWDETAMQIWCSYNSEDYELIATEAPSSLGGRHVVDAAGLYTYKIRIQFSDGQFSPWSLEGSTTITQAEVDRASVIGMRFILAGSYQLPISSLHTDQITVGLSAAGSYQAPKTYLGSEAIPVNFTISGSYETA